MLRKVEGFTIEDWENNYIALRTQVVIFRQEIHEIPEKEAATIAISKLDAYISLFAVMQIVDEIRAGNDRAIRLAFLRQTGKEFGKVHKGSMREVFAKVLEKDIRTIFEELTNNTRLSDLTGEKIKIFIFDIANQFYNKAIRKHLNDDIHGENLFTPLLVNEIFLTSAGDLYREVDDRQTASKWRMAYLMGPYLLKMFKEEALQNPFVAIRECAAFVDFSGEAMPLWKEMALWLEGMYLRSYMMIPEKYRKNGEVLLTESNKMPTVNEKDKQFQDNFNLTFYQMSLYHHQTSELIQSGLIPAVEENSGDVSKTLIQGSPLPNIMEKPYLPYCELEKIRDENESVKFPRLECFIRKYKLTEDQNNSLKAYSREIRSTLKGYNTSIFNSHYLPLTYIWARPHANLVNEKIEEIENCNNPADQILVLIDMREELRGKGSIDLINRVDELLKNALTILLLASLPPELVNQPAAR